jgi:hypothetical protein
METSDEEALRALARARGICQQTNIRASEEECFHVSFFFYTNIKLFLKPRNQ